MLQKSTHCSRTMSCAKYRSENSCQHAALSLRFVIPAQAGTHRGGQCIGVPTKSPWDIYFGRRGDDREGGSILSSPRARVAGVAVHLGLDVESSDSVRIPYELPRCFATYEDELRFTRLVHPKIASRPANSSGANAQCSIKLMRNERRWSSQLQVANNEAPASFLLTRLVHF